MQQTTLSFPEIKLRQSDGHKLRGYFAAQFGEDSDLFHNHGSGNISIYRYPLIQFKIVGGIPMIIGMDEGAQLLIDRFIKIKEIKINDTLYHLNHKNMKSEKVEIGVIADLNTYRFETPWMALNQSNFAQYQNMTETQKSNKLKSILIGNILSLYKGLKHREPQTILVTHQLNPITTKFKDQSMTAFKGSFTTNAILPDYIGIGKSVARGYGTIVKIA